MVIKVVPHCLSPYSESESESGGIEALGTLGHNHDTQTHPGEQLSSAQLTVISKLTLDTTLSTFEQTLHLKLVTFGAVHLYLVLIKFVKKSVGMWKQKW